jgi:hypothetical protein
MWCPGQTYDQHACSSNAASLIAAVAGCQGVIWAARHDGVLTPTGRHVLDGVLTPAGHVLLSSPFVLCRVRVCVCVCVCVCVHNAVFVRVSVCGYIKRQLLSSGVSLVWRYCGCCLATLVVDIFFCTTWLVALQASQLAPTKNMGPVERLKLL